MKRLFAATAFFMLSGLTLIQAQSTSNTTVTLPDISEDVRAVENAPVTVPPPDLLPVPIPSVAPPLPQEQEITIPESTLTAATNLDARSRQSSNDTFSEATVGAFLWDGVAANLSLYKPSSDPSFSIIFSHETQDGFAFHEAGSGFSYRQTRLQGNFRGGIQDSLLWSLSAAFVDQSNGLQGQSQDFYGISHRYLEIVPSIRYPMGLFTVYSELETTSGALSLERGQNSFTGDVRSQELGLHPSIGIEWAKDMMRFTLDGTYFFYGLINNPESVADSDRFSQQGQVSLGASFDISPAFQAGASVGIGSNTELTWFVPFALWFDVGLADVISASVKGGLESKAQPLRELWQTNPYSDIGPVSGIDAHWFTSSTIDIYPWKSVTLRLKSDWQSSYGGTGRIESLDAQNTDSRGLYGYEQVSFQMLNTRLEVRNSWQSTDLAIGLSSQWLDKDKKRAQQLYGSLEYRDENDRFGTAGTLTMDFDYTGVDIPSIDLNAFMRLGGGIRLVAEVSDLLMAFQGSEGRVIWAPYISTGFQAGLRLQFTL